MNSPFQTTSKFGLQTGSIPGRIFGFCWNCGHLFSLDSPKKPDSSFVFRFMITLTVGLFYNSGNTPCKS